MQESFSEILCCSLPSAHKIHVTGTDRAAHPSLHQPLPQLSGTHAPARAWNPPGKGLHGRQVSAPERAAAMPPGPGKRDLHWAPGLPGGLQPSPPPLGLACLTSPSDNLQAGAVLPLLPGKLRGMAVTPQHTLRPTPSNERQSISGPCVLQNWFLSVSNSLLSPPCSLSPASGALGFHALPASLCARRPPGPARPRSSC